MNETKKTESQSSGLLKGKGLDFSLLIALFLLNAFLVLSRLTPGLYQINPFDGAKYIESGHQLLTWGVRDLSWGPLVAFIYAPLDLIVGQSPNWFLLEAWGGNLILFGLLWFGLVHLARNLKPLISMPVMIGLLFGLTVFFPIIENQSDALFLFFSMMAVASLNSFRVKGKLRHVSLAAVTLGLGVLCRVETILLVVPLLAFALVFNRGRQKIWKVLMAGLAPLLGVIALYALISLLTVGFVDWGLGYKSVDSIGMNHAFLPGSKLEQAYRAGEPILGTVAEHQNSVLRMLLNHPLVFAERALANLLKLPQDFVYFFGPIQGMLIFLFGLLGAWRLVREKEFSLLALLLIWPLHALVALIFLPRHIIAQMSFVFIVLAAIGADDLIFREIKRKWLYLSLALAGLVILISGLTQAKSLFAASLIMAVILLLKAVVESGQLKGLKSPYLVLTLLVGVLLALGPGFEFPARVFGQTDVEQVVYQLQNDLPQQSPVLAPSAIVPVAARMVSVQLPGGVASGEDLRAFIMERGLEAIFVDNEFANYGVLVDQVIQSYPGELRLVYTSDDQSMRLFMVNSQADD
jgi:hypothetical protein